MAKVRNWWGGHAKCLRLMTRGGRGVKKSSKHAFWMKKKFWTKIPKNGHCAFHEIFINMSQDKSTYKNWPKKNSWKCMSTKMRMVLKERMSTNCLLLFRFFGSKYQWNYDNPKGCLLPLFGPNFKSSWTETNAILPHEQMYWSYAKSWKTQKSPYGLCLHLDW